MDITVTNIETATDMATLAWTVQYSDHNIINKKEKNGTESEEGKMEAEIWGMAGQQQTRNE
jgi:hypothetical protein